MARVHIDKGTFSVPSAEDIQKCPALASATAQTLRNVSDKELGVMNWRAHQIQGGMRKDDSEAPKLTPDMLSGKIKLIQAEMRRRREAKGK